MVKLKINIKLLENFIKEQNLSKTKFCKLCDIHPSTYNRIISNKRFKIIALFKIAKVIKVPISKLIID